MIDVASPPNELSIDPVPIHPEQVAIIRQVALTADPVLGEVVKLLLERLCSPKMDPATIDLTNTGRVDIVRVFGSGEISAKAEVVASSSAAGRVGVSVRASVEVFPPPDNEA